MIEMRRLAASNGLVSELRVLAGLRNPRTCETWSVRSPDSCIKRRAALARSDDSSQLP